MEQIPFVAATGRMISKSLRCERFTVAFRTNGLVESFLAEEKVVAQQIETRPAPAEPVGPGGSAASQPGHSSPLVRRTALAAPSFAATPSRLAAAGVLRAPKAPRRSARMAAIGRRFRAAVRFRTALMTTGAVQGLARRGPQTDLERRSPVARPVPAAARTWSSEQLGQAQPREIGVTAPPRARSSGVARVRPTIPGLATALTFGVIGLVAIAAASVPESHRTPILGAGGRPGCGARF